MDKESSLEERIVLPAASEEQASLAKQAEREAKLFYDDIFGPEEGHDLEDSPPKK